MASSKSQSNNHAGASGCSRYSGNVDRIFACPVCYEKYDSHIMLCKSGHSVCKLCSERLQQCPQCCAGYLGTRNYALEDFLTELQRLKTSPEEAFDDITSAAEAREIKKRTKEAEQIETLKRECHRTSHSDYVVCRLRNCRLSMPLDDLKKHFEQRHPGEFTILRATPYLSKSFFAYTVHLVNHRYALITEFGIFFLILRIEKQPLDEDEPLATLTAWIQGTCKDEEAHLFYSSIQVQRHTCKASYHDYVQGCRPTVADIEGKNECLKVSLHMSDETSLRISGYVCLNKFSNNPHPRRTITEIWNTADNNAYSDSE
ncbi:E3 ubiquitin-protein ligase SIAH1B-like [Lutzomyia longipalpis]|uniref:E3 ubiquitin-protein ligase SIAH1B-like n=1 Tax=Lutzomyia longipalpis TaxID=7200 RepID=UPI002483960E|nr:E3 ubiquitin-protein ligase SIAH1B-like [Lutzomyia longipalpis]